MSRSPSLHPSARLRRSMPPVALATALAAMFTTNAAYGVARSCNGEVMPQLEARFPVVCAADFGITPDLPHDQRWLIQSALDRLAGTRSGLYFPKGRYVVAGDLFLRDGNSLVGSRAGSTVWTAPADGETAAVTSEKSLTGLLIEGLQLQNLLIALPDAGKSIIRYNALYGTRSAFPQLHVGNGSLQIHGNVLTRGPTFPGNGLALYATTDAVVTGNLMGDLRATSLPAYADVRTQALVRRVLAVSAEPGATRQDGGHYQRIWSDDFSVRSVFRFNHIALAGTPQAGEAPPVHFSRQLLSTISDNLISGTDGGVPQRGSRTVRLEGLVSSSLYGNVLDSVELQFVAGNMHANATTGGRSNSVFGNQFYESLVRVIPAELPSRSTNPTTLLLSNQFWWKSPSATACPIGAAPDADPTLLQIADNRWMSDVAVSACNGVKEVARDAALSLLPASLKAAATESRLLMNGLTWSESLGGVAAGKHRALLQRLDAPGQTEVGMTATRDAASSRLTLALDAPAPQGLYRMVMRTESGPSSAGAVLAGLVRRPTAQTIRFVHYGGGYPASFSYQYTDSLGIRRSGESPSLTWGQWQATIPDWSSDVAVSATSRRTGFAGGMPITLGPVQPEPYRDACYAVGAGLGNFAWGGC